MKTVIQLLCLVVLSLGMLVGCSATLPKRINTAASLPHMVTLPHSSGAKSPEQKENEVPIVFGANYVVGESVRDTGKVGSSKSMNGSMGFRATDNLTFGGQLFLGDNNGLEDDDNLSGGVGVFGNFLVSESERTAFRIYGAIRYSENINEANNCDAVGREPKDANGNCIIIWRSSATVKLTHYASSFLITKKWSHLFWTTFAPGFIVETFESNNHADTLGPDINHEGSQILPTMMVYQDYVLPSKAHLYGGVGWSMMKQYGEFNGITRHLFLAEVGLNFY